MTKNEVLEIYERIDTKCREIALSREEFADLIGVSVEKIESDSQTSQISVDTLIKISKSLHVDIEYLVLGKKKQSEISEPVLELLKNCSKQELKQVYQMLEIFLKR